jgi:hypothetical protein
MGDPQPRQRFSSLWSGISPTFIVRCDVTSLMCPRRVDEVCRQKNSASPELRLQLTSSRGWDGLTARLGNEQMPDRRGAFASWNVRPGPVYSIDI